MLEAYHGKLNEEKCLIGSGRKISMFFLQEVHCTKETCDLWQNEWGCKAFFSCENSRRAGVAILFKNNFDFVLNKDYADPDGRFIILDIKTAGLCFTLVNLYAPNKDDPISSKMLKTEYSNLIAITSSWVKILT